MSNLEGLQARWKAVLVCHLLAYEHVHCPCYNVDVCGCIIPHVTHIYYT